MRLRSLATVSLVPLVLTALTFVSPVAPAGAATPTVTANRAPYAVVAGSATGLGAVRDIATGDDGRVYALLSSSVVVFAPGARGNAAPERRFGFAAPSGQTGWRLTVDADGFVTVLANAGSAGLGAATVLVFGPAATGAATPVVDATNVELDIEQPLDLTDVGDEVAFVDLNRNDVRTYDLRGGATTPTRVIAAGSATQTRIFSPFTIGSDASGRIALGGPDWVSTFAAGAEGDVAPRTYVQGARTTLRSTGSLSSIAFTSRGDLVVSSIDYEGQTATRSRVLRFAAGARGDVAPAAVLGGSRTGLAEASFSDVLANGSIATIEISGQAFVGTGTAIALHRPLGPYTAPGRPASLRVTGSTAAAKRTVTWKGAATQADVPVTAYVVTVVCGGRTRLNKTYGARTRSVAVSLGTFTRGTCSARVAARNVVGTGAASARTFSVRR